RDWTANSAEAAGGSGDNAYAQGFARGAAGALALHLAGHVDAWEVWNEPNAWTRADGAGRFAGGTYLYPSNFAWLLRRSRDAIKQAQPTAQVIAGGLLGHDLLLAASFGPPIAGPARDPRDRCASTLPPNI